MAALCCRVQERSHSNALHSVAPKPGCAVSSPPLQEYKELLKELSTLEAPRRSQTILWPSGVDGHTNSFPHVRSLQCCTYADHLCTTCDNMSNLIIDNVTFGFWRGKTTHGPQASEAHQQSTGGCFGWTFQQETSFFPSPAVPQTALGGKKRYCILFCPPAILLLFPWLLLPPRLEKIKQANHNLSEGLHKRAGFGAEDIVSS